MIKELQQALSEKQMMLDILEKKAKEDVSVCFCSFANLP